MDRAEQDLSKLKYAAHLFRQKRFKECESLYKSLITSRHAGPSAKSHLGLLYLHQGKTSEAEQLFESVISEGHQVAEAHYGLGVIREPSDPGYARAQYEFALRINPKHRGSIARIKKLESTSRRPTQTPEAADSESDHAPAQEQSHQLHAATEEQGQWEPQHKFGKLLIEGNPLAAEYVLRYVLVSCISSFFLIWFVDLFNSLIPSLLGVAAVLAWVVVSERNRRSTLFKIFEGRIDVTRGAETKSVLLRQVSSVQIRQKVTDKLLGTAGMFVAHVLPNGKSDHVSILALASLSKMKEVAASLRAFSRDTKGEDGHSVISSKFPLNYTGIATNVRYRTEQRGDPPRQFQIIEFRLQRAKGLVPVQVYMGGVRIKGTIKEGDQIVLKDREPKEGFTYETRQVYNESAGGYVVMFEADIISAKMRDLIVFIIIIIIVIVLFSWSSSGKKRRQALHETHGDPAPVVQIKRSSSDCSSFIACAPQGIDKNSAG